MVSSRLETTLGDTPEGRIVVRVGDKGHDNDRGLSMAAEMTNLCNNDCPEATVSFVRRQSNSADVFVQDKPQDRWIGQPGGIEA